MATSSKINRSPSTSRRASLDETAPLLPPSSTERNNHDTHSFSSSDSTSAATDNPWVRVVVIVAAIIFVCDLGSYAALPSQTRLYESITCYKFYTAHDRSRILPDGTVPEALCKVNDIQDTVAILFGWQNVWDALPGFLLGVPYGSLADKWGRKPILYMCLAALVVAQIWIILVCYYQLPLYMVWFSSAFTLVGGGPIVGSSLLFTMASDVVPAERRTAAFLWLHASILVGEMLGPLICNPLMKKSIWLPLIVSTVLVASGVFGIYLLPETMHISAKNRQSDDELEDMSIKVKEGLFTRLIKYFRETWDFIFQDGNVALIILSCASSTVGMQAMVLLLQYSSKRYHWAIADAALLGTLRAAVNLVLFLFILPWLASFLASRLHLSADRASLEISRWSAILMMLGLFAVGLSPDPILMIIGLVIYTCGTGFGGSMRSVAVALLGGEKSPHMAKLFSVIGVMSALGSVVTGPMLPLAFHWGQEIGGAGLGLPFLFSGGVFGAVAVLAFLVGIPKNGNEEEERD